MRQAGDGADVLKRKPMPSVHPETQGVSALTGCVQPLELLLYLLWSGVRVGPCVELDVGAAGLR